VHTEVLQHEGNEGINEHCTFAGLRAFSALQQEVTGLESRKEKKMKKLRETKFKKISEFDDVMMAAKNDVTSMEQARM
jgi:hypothetical protein